jgi:hypothetical protein
MKVFDKYLVIAKYEDGKTRIAASFKTQKEAADALTRAFGKCTENNWQDRNGTMFYIEKNTKEYK